LKRGGRKVSEKGREKRRRKEGKKRGEEKRRRKEEKKRGEEKRGRKEKRGEEKRGRKGRVLIKVLTQGAGLRPASSELTYNLPKIKVSP
jgi:hypothetical protein